MRRKTLIKIARWLNGYVMSRYSKYEGAYGHVAEYLMQDVHVDVITHYDPVTHQRR